MKFPRNVPVGRLLMGLVAAIVWWVMYHAATDEWKWAQPLIFIGVPVAYLLVVNFGTHYLTLRAVAALLLLVGFGHESKILLVVADEPTRGGSRYGGIVAAPTFSRIAERTLRYLQVAPSAPTTAQLARRRYCRRDH